jgi:hypothetical protein
MKTRHFKERMSQRGIRKRVVELVLEYGRVLHKNKRQLDCKAIDSLISELDNTKSTLLDARKKGGVVVVLEGECLITTYGLGR